jgi:hypothetical protein
VPSRSTEPKKTVYRDSRDGQFITKREAEQRPDMSEKERVRIRPPSLPKKGK